MSAWIEILACTLATAGFSIIFNVPRQRLLPISLGGGLIWLIYLILGQWTQSNVIRYIAACAMLTFYAELMARKYRCPATLFLVPAIVPLMPGGILYYAMEAAIQKRWQDFGLLALQVLMLAVAIACGILCAMTVVHICKMRSNAKRK